MAIPDVLLCDAQNSTTISIVLVFSRESASPPVLHAPALFSASACADITRFFWPAKDVIHSLSRGLASCFRPLAFEEPINLSPCELQYNITGVMMENQMEKNMEHEMETAIYWVI